jgi:hypothetical protein
VGRQALRILDVQDPEHMSKDDMLLFLYAVGLNPTDDLLDYKIRSLGLGSSDTYTFGHVCHIWWVEWVHVTHKLSW